MASEARYLLDTNICLYLLDGHSPQAARRLAVCEPGQVVTSSVCLAEILLRLSAEQAPVLQIFLRQIAVVSFDEDAARAYARQPFKRARFDRLIGAHAYALGLILVTANTRDFTDIPGLPIEDWTRE